MLFTVPSNLPVKVENEFLPAELERQAVDYVDTSYRFYQVSRDFSKQYAHIYSARLNAYRTLITTIIRKKWPSHYKILKLCELREKHEKCIVIGTIFKLQELKPSILKDLSEQLEIIPQPPRTHFVHDSDSLVLEDELQRIRLIGDSIDVHQVVTGVVCAVLGSEDEDGVFTIEDVCWAGCSIQKPFPKLANDRYIVLLSGLNMASKKPDHLFSLHLLLEWLSGISGTSQYQEELSKVVRVIVAGGVFASYSDECILNESDVIASAESVDAFAAAVSAVAPLDLMPGCKDPSGIMLPQKPFHYCLFPKAVEYKSFHRVPNPYECDIAGFTCLGTSGEPLKNIMKYSNLNNRLEIMKNTLKWRHMAPTCPDTVPCTPCVVTDPFIIQNCPAIYFSGNSEEFATDVYKGEDGQHVRLVCLPDFSTSKTMAIVNLQNLECFSMTFS
ncbi:DNA polymerase delta subunit 2 [Achroia grisella]|uniref:DNA polymerase delta subunit 2 n=1 Tax=Achroia grisella TaxID=688607 RepID=UPI0027D2A130|nr:DNA polymerase delta subunit 2 [Achroia grisella]XP_059053767.1 DNA polymerase delta subunit 2 [Achroia grisella]